MESASTHMLIALGGAMGASLRWGGVELATRTRVPTWTAIMLVNVLGCLVLGVASAVVLTPDLEAFLVGGLLGGFTTFSTAMLDAWVLWRSGRRFASGACLSLTPVLGVAAAWCGWSLVGLLAMAEGGS